MLLAEPAFGAGVTLSVPLTTAEAWLVLSYRRIPPNRLRAGPLGLEIIVERSAGPIVHALSPPRRVARVEVAGRIDGRLRLASTATQGDKGFDDYVLRVGLVETGTRTLGTLRRPFAAGWVKRLFDLAPRGTGLSRIRFLNVGADSGRVGVKRRHPLSDLLFEEVVTTPDDSGAFHLSVPVDPPTEVAAIWLSADGDDTASSFVVRITRFELALAGE